MGQRGDREELRGSSAGQRGARSGETLRDHRTLQPTRVGRGDRRSPFRRTRREGGRNGPSGELRSSSQGPGLAIPWRSRLQALQAL